MNRLLITSGVLLGFLVSPLLAIDLKVPTNVKGEPGDFVSVKADTDGKEVRWYAIDTGLKLFPPALLKDSKTAVVTSSKAGTYKLLAYTADDKGGLSEPAVCLVIIGDPVPVPPPTPPTPPVPPAPTDPLTLALQAAYSLDADADRAKSLDFLQHAYKGMAEQVVAVAAQKNLKTNADFVTWMKSVVESPGNGLTAGQIKGLRTAIAKELGSSWGANTAPLAPADAAVELAKIATALSGVK